MYSYIKSFYSEKRANKFVEELKAQGIKADVWSYKDGFGQIQYDVCWNK